MLVRHGSIRSAIRVYPISGFQAGAEMENAAHRAGRGYLARGIVTERPRRGSGFGSEASRARSQRDAPFSVRPFCQTCCCDLWGRFLSPYAVGKNVIPYPLLSLRRVALRRSLSMTQFPDPPSDFPWSSLFVAVSSLCQLLTAWLKRRPPAKKRDRDDIR